MRVLPAADANCRLHLVLVTIHFQQVVQQVARFLVPPRPGNNPFSTGWCGSASTCTSTRLQGSGAPRPGMAGSRPGSVRPGFAARPGAPRPAGGAGASGQQVHNFLHALEQVHHHQLLLINQMHQVLVAAHYWSVHNVHQVAVVHHNAVAQAGAFGKNASKNLGRKPKVYVRRYAMSSTICRHHNLVAQLFLTVMARRLFVCVAWFIASRFRRQDWCRSSSVSCSTIPPW